MIVRKYPEDKDKLIREHAVTVTFWSFTTKGEVLCRMNDGYLHFLRVLIIYTPEKDNCYFLCAPTMEGFQWYRLPRNEDMRLYLISLDTISQVSTEQCVVEALIC